MRRAAPPRQRPASKPPRRVHVAASAARARGILAASHEEASISSLTASAPLATVIFLVTIALVITRPRGLTEARAALLGAVVMVLAGLLPFGDAASNVGGHWNVLLFFVGLTGAAAIAERSGLFEALAGTSARLSGGSPRRLLVAVVLAGALVAALLSNDAAALVLTPVVYVLVARFGLEPLPYVLACTFVADAASLALPVSNPVNVIVSDRLGISAVSLVPVLLPAAIAAVVALLGCLLVIYRRQLPAAAPILPAADSWASWAGVPRPLLAAFGLAVAVFAIASALDVPLGPTLTTAWLFLLVVERRCGRTVAPLEGIGWSLLVFVAAMGVLVDGLSVRRRDGMARQSRAGPGARPAGRGHGRVGCRGRRRREPLQQPAGGVRAGRCRSRRGPRRSERARGRHRDDHRRGSRSQLDACRLGRHAALVRAPAAAGPGGVDVELHPGRAHRDPGHDPRGARRRAAAGRAPVSDR